jgi:hypothetical protein
VTSWGDDDRARWTRALTTAGWSFVIAWLLMLVAQVRRAALVQSSPFADGVWGQRIEWISFVALPQNLIVLVPGVACAVATVLIGAPATSRSIWSAHLHRVAAGSSLVAIVIAVLGMLDLLVQSPDADGSIAALLTRLAGLLMGTAMLAVCQAVEHRN